MLALRLRVTQLLKISNQPGHVTSIKQLETFLETTWVLKQDGFVPMGHTPTGPLAQVGVAELSYCPTTTHEC